MDGFKLAALQNKELEILKEIDRICKKYNIRWTLAGGSVLGAVRHGGFIPWDDDIDIYMLETDYERFEQVCQTELDPDKYFIQTIETDKNCPVPWAKVRMNNTCSMDEEYKDIRLHWGICIDIFLLQYAPADDCKLDEMTRLKWIYSGICHVAFEKCPGILQFKDFCIYWERKLLRLPIFRKRLKAKIAFYSGYTDYKRLSDDVNMRVFPASYFEKVSMVRFEDAEYPCPYEPEKYLDQVYGDWRKLPAEEERYGHRGIIVDTEKSYLEYQKR